MSAHTNGGPAFPGSTFNDSDCNATDPFGALLPPQGVAYYPGMTLRDYFAAKAMQALVQQRCYPHDQMVGQHAYMVADLMLKARQA